MDNRSRKGVTIVIATVLVTGMGLSAWAATGPSGPVYRTTRVLRGDVDTTITSTATLEPVSQAAANFSISGRVATLDVTTGQQVALGQRLASLDTSALTSQVASDQASVAAAQARLAADEASQTDVVSASSSASPAGGGLVSDQGVIRSTQHRIDSELSAVTALLRQENTLCQGLLTPSPTPSPSASPSATPVASGSPSPAPAAAGHPGPGGGPGRAPGGSLTCQTALSQVLTDQTRIATDEQSLAAAEARLGATLAAASATMSTSSRRGTTSGSGPASAAQLGADQANIDAATAQLAAAQQNVNAAVLVSPLSGTVAVVNVTQGGALSASTATGTSAQFLIIGPGTDQALTTVNDIYVGQVKVGQPAVVTPDGSSTPLPGQVVSVGLLTSGTSSAAYPVTIGLAPHAGRLFAGAGATVSITLKRSTAVLSVPTSAVHNNATGSYVNEVRGGKLTVVNVVTGAVGPTYTEIVSGLSVGEAIVLANLSTPLPTNSSTNIRGLTGPTFIRGGGGGARRAAGG